MRKTVTWKCRFFYLLFVVVAGCVAAPPLQETCTFQPDVRLSTFGYRSLLVVAGLPEGHVPRDPRMMLYSPSLESPTRILRFSLRPTDAFQAPGLNRSGCRNLEWHYFTPDADASEWADFWSQSGSERFTVGYTFNAGTPAAAPRRSFGLAVSDADSGQVIFSCGCFSL